MPLRLSVPDNGTFSLAGCERRCTVNELTAECPSALDGESAGTLHHGRSANGCYACEVEIDPETGQTTLLAYTAVDDFGTVVNEGVVTGQVHGGIAMGPGQALLEKGVYDAVRGQATGTLMTYALPRSINLPGIEWISNGLTSSTNVLGAKACAETGVSASPPTIMNAVVDTLCHCAGAERLQMPARPEAVLQLIHGMQPAPNSPRPSA
jgi:carbon-monoxide dehydrogenase large subunit